VKQRGAVLSVLMTVAACASPASSPLGPVASLAPAPSTPLPLPALIEPSPSLEPAGGTPIAAQSLSGTIVYSTGSDKNDDVFLLRLDGSEPVRLTDAPEKEFDPDLSANGA
jgi:hypothetical protein